MIRTLMFDLLARRHCRHAVGTLRALESKFPRPSSRLAVPFVFRGRGHFKRIEPRQNPFEIEHCLRDVCGLKPRRVVEIGTANGGTLYLWTQVASECAVILSIDLPGGDFGGAYPRCRTAFYRSFARGAQSISMILADSHSPQTRKKVVAYFDGERLDYLFIDGDHTYTGVKCDFQQYGPLVRPGGLIGFHDILPRRDEPGIQVYRLWEELKAKYETWSYVAPEGKGRRIGIGLLRVPDGGVGAVL